MEFIRIAQGLTGSQGPPGEPVPAGTVENFGVTTTSSSADNHTNIQTAMTWLNAASGRCLQFGSGTYNFTTTSGSVMLMTATDSTIRGAGIGQTILNFSNSTLTAETAFIRPNGLRQTVNGFSITTGDNFGSNNVGFYPISVYTAALYPTVKDIDIKISGLGNMAGSAGNGSGIATYMVGYEVLYSTTSTESIATGSDVTVTPANMDGIYPGRQLHIEWTGNLDNSAEGNAEIIVVKTITATTFVADFTLDHTAGATIKVRSDAMQHGEYENITVHDSYNSQGVVLNSSGNNLAKVNVRNVGKNNLVHGFYVQGGNNKLTSCSAEGVSGWSYHYYPVSGNRNNSGNELIDSHSLNPGAGHIVFSGITGVNYTSPELPYEEPSSYGLVVRGGSYKTTRSFTGTIANVGTTIQGTGFIIDGAWFEDATNQANVGFVTVNNGSGRITNNTFKRTNITDPMTAYAITASLTSGLIAGNHVLSGDIKVDGPVIVKDNTLDAGKLVLGTGSPRFEHNYVTNAGYAFYSSASGTVNLIDNIFTSTSGTYSADVPYWPMGDVRGNTWNLPFRLNGGGLGRIVGPNNGAWANNSYNTGLAVTLQSNALMSFFAPPATVVPSGYLVKIDSAGLVSKIATTDTNFLGIAVLTAGEYVPGLVAYQSGSIVSALTDDTWTKSNYGAISWTVAGKVHDIGEAPPEGEDYVQFLDSGTGAGAATVMIFNR